LPAGQSLLFLKLDHAAYKTFNFDPAYPESDHAKFWMAGLGYGVMPWFSAYVFVPYHIKKDEQGGFDTRGLADVSLMGQIGFKYDQGLMLTPANESLDDLEDWHFALYGGVTLPSGKPNLRDSLGAIDSGNRRVLDVPPTPGFDRQQDDFTASDVECRSITAGFSGIHLR
jgi:hypothetical protein